MNYYMSRKTRLFQTTRYIYLRLSHGSGYMTSACRCLTGEDLGKGPEMGWFLEYTLNTHRVTFPVKNLGIQMMQADTLLAWDLL